MVRVMAITRMACDEFNHVAPTSGTKLASLKSLAKTKWLSRPRIFQL
jgi:hypothetical protein